MAPAPAAGETWRATASWSSEMSMASTLEPAPMRSASQRDTVPVPQPMSAARRASATPAASSPRRLIGP